MKTLSKFSKLEPNEAKRCLISIVIEFLGICVLSISTFDTFIQLGKDKGDSLTFFTNQSNILMWLTLLIFFSLNIYRFVTGDDLRKHWLYVFKFTFTCGVLLTLLVYNILLSDFPNDLTSKTYWSFHLLGPIIALIDFLYSDYAFKHKWWDILITMAFPIYYVIFELSLSYGGYRWKRGGAWTVSPYGFLDYESHTWFSAKNNDIGVFYYIIIIAVLFALMAWLLAFLKDLRLKQITKLDNKKSQ